MLDYQIQCKIVVTSKIQLYSQTYLFYQINYLLSTFVFNFILTIENFLIEKVFLIYNRVLYI